MRYLKALFFNFLIVFFADHVLPGVQVADQTKLPHIGGDLLFAFSLGLLNSLIFPVLKVMDKHRSSVRIAMVALVLNFAAYALIKILPIDIQILSVEGYILAVIAVSLGSFCINFAEVRRHESQIPKTPFHPPSEQ